MHSKVYRIIDVNLNRATEGLRVVEEVCRFVLEDPKLTLAVKKLRGSLPKVAGITSRDVKGDVGREPYTRDEGRRKNMESVFRANMKRAQEAVRCLEEFSKLIDPGLGKRFKALRFKLYQLEKIIVPRVSKVVKLDFDLYVVTDPQFGHFRMVRKAIAGKVKIIQLRDETVTKQKYYRLARKIAGITRKANVTLILNDYWELVDKVGADGVHLGQEDLKHASIRTIRKKLGEDKIIGISAYTLGQALRAQKMGADYVSVWPIFRTPFKPGIKPVGLGLLRKVVKRLKIPVVAIGGIDRGNVDKVRKTGCQRVAVIRAAKELIG